MTVIHANDPTTKFLSYLYERRQDVSARITEASTNSDIQRAIRGDDNLGMGISMVCSQSPIRMVNTIVF